MIRRFGIHLRAAIVSLLWPEITRRLAEQARRVRVLGRQDLDDMAWLAERGRRIAEARDLPASDPRASLGVAASMPGQGPIAPNAEDVQ